MNNFSLSKRIDKVFPETTTVDGETFSVNADFRVCLRILRLLDDETVFHLHKVGMIARWFFDDGYPRDVMAAINAFFTKSHDGIRGQSPDNEIDSTDFCYEFDADVIYTSFLQAYQIDLLRVPFLHWYDFQLRLIGLPDDSPFRLRLRLRGLDLSHYKGKELLDLSTAKEAVQLPEKYSAAELQQADEFEAMWDTIGR